MPYMQTDRLITVDTPLGKDVMLLTGFAGQEGLSRLFSFQLELLAQKEVPIEFDKLLGQKITVALAGPHAQHCYFNGICKRMSQGTQDNTFTSYQMEVVPQFWLLTRRAQSRIFQQMAVPDILKKVLEGLDVTFEIQGTFHPRDYCVQYRETDFNFACRLMEEEGIYYFFKHTSDGHKLIVANTPQSHPDVPIDNTIIFEAEEGGNREEDRISRWEKVQELRSGKYTLWDHCFELPHKHLEADHQIQDTVKAGKVTHKLKVGGNEKLEIYDYPGEYAQRFDGVDRGGGGRAADLQKIFADNARTVEIRMQQEALPSLIIQGSGNCRQLVSGHKFTLEQHFNADGQYVITGVSHLAKLAGDFRTGEGMSLDYRNTFTCIPFAIPFRPPRTTPKPVVQGTQTAVVVGPPGEEIFTDKYGRVKVQFHWDREGKNNAESSCWVRVAQNWAGKRWGAMFIPRIGQEVITDFIEGDPDDPIIIGCVYNAENMPPYALPGDKTRSTIKSNSSIGGGGFNEFRFEDKKGSEEVFLHGQKDWTIAIENDKNQTVGHDETLSVGNDKTAKIGHDDTLSVGNNQSIAIGVDQTEKIGSNMTLIVGGAKTEVVALVSTETVGGAKALTIGAAYQVSVAAAMNETVGGLKAEQVGAAKSEAVGGSKSESIGGGKTFSAGKDFSENVGGNHKVTVAKDSSEEILGKSEVSVKKDYIVQSSKKISIQAGDEILIKTGSASILMKKNGDIEIQAKKFTVKASGEINLKGQKISEN